MEKIVWHPSYSVGVELLDEHHKRIFDMINMLILDSDTKVFSETVSELLTKLTKYARDHFRTEELLMEEHGYSDFDIHKKEHLELRIKTVALCQDTMNHQDTVPEELLQLMKAWWMDHILESDMKYKPFLAEHGVK